MKFIMFHGGIHSLNYFTDELVVAFQNIGHDVRIIDLNGKLNVSEFICELKYVDAVICYNCIGTFTQSLENDISKMVFTAYHTLDIPIVNIFMDHPMNLNYYLLNVPSKNIQFCPDAYHVEYIKKYFKLEHTYFLPHMASAYNDEGGSNEIDVLFSGAVQPCNELFSQLLDNLPGNSMRTLALEIIEFLLENPIYTMESALELVLKKKGMDLQDRYIAAFMANSKDIDRFIRFYFREKVISTIIRAEIPITLLGRGWERLSFTHKSNVAILPECGFADVFSYMKQAKITLTVMPWFKAGTHDRIFNSLLHGSCPLTDTSEWLLENFEPNVECAYYSLEAIDKVPEKIYYLLNHPELREEIITNGRKKVLNNYTSKQIAETIIDYLYKCFPEKFSVKNEF